MSLPPAGWYPDPHGEAPSRWWDGTGWTAHTAPPAHAPTPAAMDAPAEPSAHPYAPADPNDPMSDTWRHIEEGKRHTSPLVRGLSQYAEAELAARMQEYDELERLRPGSIVTKRFGPFTMVSNTFSSGFSREARQVMGGAEMQQRTRAWRRSAVVADRLAGTNAIAAFGDDVHQALATPGARRALRAAWIARNVGGWLFFAAVAASIVFAYLHGQAASESVPPPSPAVTSSVAG